MSIQTAPIGTFVNPPAVSIRHRGRERGPGRPVSTPIYFSKDLSGEYFPIGVQINRRVDAEWLTITPGLVYIGSGPNVGGINGSVGLRVYQTNIADDMQWILTNKRSIPYQIYHCQLFAGSVTIAWARELQLFVELISSVTGVLPPGSFVEFSIAPFGD